MKDNIEYNYSDDFDKEYGIQGTQQLIQTKKGHCFDTSNMLIDVLRKNGFDVSAYFVLEVDENGNGGTSHTFVVLKENDHSYYWIEVSWDNKQGIHHYSSLNSLFDDVFKSWDFADEQNYLLFWDADYYTTKDGLKDYIQHFISKDGNDIEPFKEYKKDQKVITESKPSYARQVLRRGNIPEDVAREQAKELANKFPGEMFCYGWIDKGCRTKEFFTPFNVDDNQLEILRKTKSNIWQYTKKA